MNPPRAALLYLICLFCCASFTCPAMAKNDPGVNQNTSSVSTELATALSHFYKKEYARALPIFKRIYQSNPSLDVQFWMAYCASKTGDCDLAISSYRSILEKHPGDQEIAFEIGMVYVACGDYARARQEFELILMNSPTPDMKADIEDILNKIHQTSWSVRLTQGVQYDDNITCGPSESFVEDAGDGVPIEGHLEKTDSWNWLTDIRGDFSYDMGKPGYFSWYSSLSLFNSVASEDSEFNYMETKVDTGPVYRNWPNIISVPVRVSNVRYGTSSLSNKVSVSPEGEHFFSDRYSLRLGYSVYDENYVDESYEAAGYDNVTQTVSIGPKVYLDNRHHILAADFSLQYSDADEDLHSYDSYGGTLSYYARFSTKTDVYALYKYHNRKYDGIPTKEDEKREDSRDTVILIIGQNIYTNLFLSAEFTYIKNNSNAELYDFDKTTGTLTAGLKF